MYGAGWRSDDGTLAVMTLPGTAADLGALRVPPPFLAETVTTRSVNVDDRAATVVEPLLVRAPGPTTDGGRCSRPTTWARWWSSPPPPSTLRLSRIWSTWRRPYGRPARSSGTRSRLRPTAGQACTLTLASTRSPAGIRAASAGSSRRPTTAATASPSPPVPSWRRNRCLKLSNRKRICASGGGSAGERLYRPPKGRPDPDAARFPAFAIANTQTPGSDGEGSDRRGCTLLPAPSPARRRRMGGGGVPRPVRRLRRAFLSYESTLSTPRGHIVTTLNVKRSEGRAPVDHDESVSTPRTRPRCRTGPRPTRWRGRVAWWRRAPWRRATRTRWQLPERW